MGKNVLAVHCRNTTRPKTFVDVGLYVRGDNGVPFPFEKVYDRVARYRYLHSALGLRFFEQQRWHEAAVQFHKSANMWYEAGLPKWVWAALLYHHSGDMDHYRQLAADVIERDVAAEVFEHIEQITDESPAERVGHITKAYLLSEPSDETLAGLSEMADRATQLDSKAVSPKIAKALVAYWKNDFDEASEWADKCGNENSQAICVLGLVHAKTGELDQAQRELARLDALNVAFPTQISLKKKNASHEAAFLKMLIEVVRQSVVASNLDANK